MGERASPVRGLDRLNALVAFYSALDLLSDKVGGARFLSACSGRFAWPQRGVYFFYEAGELRRETGQGLRVVRVGTHALKTGSKTTLWTRLSQHRGQQSTGGGNHRGSIFRQILGDALIKREGLNFPSWGDGYTANRNIRVSEFELERRVSDTIGKMSFLWLPIDDAAGPDSHRGYIERNSIALLSNYDGDSLDPPSSNWLGHDCSRERVRKSGLWNQNHVDETFDPDFLETFHDLVQNAGHAS